MGESRPFKNKVERRSILLILSTIFIFFLIVTSISLITSSEEFIKTFITKGMVWTGIFTLVFFISYRFVYFLLSRSGDILIPSYYDVKNEKFRVKFTGSTKWFTINPQQISMVKSYLIIYSYRLKENIKITTNKEYYCKAILLDRNISLDKLKEVEVESNYKKSNVKIGDGIDDSDIQWKIKLTLISSFAVTFIALCLFLICVIMGIFGLTTQIIFGIFCPLMIISIWIRCYLNIKDFKKKLLEHQNERKS